MPVHNLNIGRPDFPHLAFGHPWQKRALIYLFLCVGSLRQTGW